jgi:peptidoglycan L-alanyl-D-glutamate endopeptidase CwlK
MSNLPATEQSEVREQGSAEPPIDTESVRPSEEDPKPIEPELPSDKATRSKIKDIAIAVSSVISAVAIPVVGYWVSSAVKNKEIEGKFVELAVTILKEEPKASQLNLRQWATEIINHYSGISLSKEAASDLINRTVIPSPNLDVRTASNLERLQPRAAELARQLVEKALEKGIVIRIISGLRTMEEQDALYAQGRTKPGRIVTTARGGFSVHNTGLAFDIGVFREDKYIDEDPTYNTVGQIGKSLGLIWGGDLPAIKDVPHFETPDAQEVLKQMREKRALMQSSPSPAATATDAETP